MSRQSLVLGEFVFRDGVSDEEKRRTIEELEEVTEAKIEWVEKWKCYKWVEKINWMSHTESDNIEKAITKSKDKLKYLECSVYYLLEPDETFSFDVGSNKEKVEHYRY